MDQLISAFQREADGAWTCSQSAVLQTHAGPIQFTPGATFAPGFMFMGVDVARLLNDYRYSGVAPVAWRGECPPRGKSLESGS
jgi:hypothetical protein